MQYRNLLNIFIGFFQRFENWHCIRLILNANYLICKNIITITHFQEHSLRNLQRLCKGMWRLLLRIGDVTQGMYHQGMYQGMYVIIIILLEDLK